MVGETGLAEDVAGRDQAVPTGEVRRRRRRVKVRKRNQTKFPRPVRVALWLGFPVVLWGGIYLLGRALLGG